MGGLEGRMAHGALAALSDERDLACKPGWEDLDTAEVNGPFPSLLFDPWHMLHLCSKPKPKF